MIKNEKRDYMKKYYELHKEELRAKAKIYERSYAGKARAQRYRDVNKDKIKERNKKYQGRLIRFKGKHIWLSHNPRIGICAECHRRVDRGEINITNLHHFKYDEKDPLAHTIELCVDCHNKMDPRSRNNLGQFSKDMKYTFGDGIKFLISEIDKDIEYGESPEEFFKRKGREFNEIQSKLLIDEMIKQQKEELL